MIFTMEVYQFTEDDCSLTFLIQFFKMKIIKKKENQSSKDHRL